MSKNPILVEGGACKREFNVDKRREYREFRWVDGMIYKGMWKNDKAHSSILVCRLIFILDELILYWKFNKVKFTWFTKNLIFIIQKRNFYLISRFTFSISSKK